MIANRTITRSNADYRVYCLLILVQVQYMSAWSLHWCHVIANWKLITNHYLYVLTPLCGLGREGISQSEASQLHSLPISTINQQNLRWSEHCQMVAYYFHPCHRIDCIHIAFSHFGETWIPLYSFSNRQSHHSSNVYIRWLHCVCAFALLQPKAILACLHFFISVRNTVVFVLIWLHWYHYHINSGMKV